MLYLYVMKNAFRLTVIEVVVILIFASLAALVLLYQMANITASQRDNDRKTSINAMYYNLEEVFYEKNGYYPLEINSEVLRAMDPDLFTDPQGVALGEPASDYRYDGIDCQNNQCSAYKLIARLDKEADYVKVNRN